MKNLDLTGIETSGLHLIEASAGTGKTWTISALYILLLLESRLRPEEILVVTYTKAATAELRDRIRGRISSTLDLFSTGRLAADPFEELLRDGRPVEAETAVLLLTRALYAFDDAAIFTIHGFCQRALQDNAFESGSLFDTEMITDQGALVRETCEDFWRARILAGEEELLEQLVAAGHSPEKLAEPFKGQYQNPLLTIIPRTADPDLTAPAARRNALFPRLAALWDSDRDEILGQLAGARLNQNSYKPGQIDTAAAALSRWLRQTSPVPPCDKLEFFSRRKIEGRKTAASVLPTHPFFDLCREMHDAVTQLSEAFREKLIHRQAELHGWLKEELARRKQARNQRCFDDLLLDLHRALAADGGSLLAHTLRGRYKAALIDEFQDTDPLQWQIFARLADVSPELHTAEGHGDSDAVNGEMCRKSAAYPLYLIGDPKQAIYSFRGADIFAYIAAAAAVAPDNRATLGTNRRSVDPLVDAVNTLFMGADDPFLCRDIVYQEVASGRDTAHGLFLKGEPVADPLRFWVYPRADQDQAEKKQDACRNIVRCVAEEIARLLDGGSTLRTAGGERPLAPGDIAVLVKAHYQADLVQEALRERGIPSVQHGSATIFASGEALDLLRILRAAEEPYRERLVREALLTRTMGMAADELAQYLENGDDRAWELWLQRFRALRDAAGTGGIIALSEQLLGKCGVRSNTLGQTGGERLLTNVLHCIEMLHQAEQEQGLTLEGLITWLERRIISHEESDAALLRLETDADAVQLSTIHASKGLEYPVVFIPFAWDAPSARLNQVLFHDEANQLTLDLGSDDQEANKETARRERDAEAARLLYVAVTRAEFLCYVAWGSMTDAHGAPLFRLLHGTTVGDPARFRSYPDRDILADLRARGEGSKGLTAAMMPLDHPAPPYTPSAVQDAPFTCRTLRHPIRTDWRVSSFSGLTAGNERPVQPRDYDLQPTPVDAEGETVPAPRPAHGTIFDFPRGAAAGTCLHEMFERLDFAAPAAGQVRQVAAARLAANGFGDEWLAATTRMLSAVLEVPLLPDDPGFCLSRLPAGSWVTELEFFLPVEHLAPDALQGLFDGLLDPARHGDFAAVLASLNFRQSRGLLHGFIDMVFEHGGRYYLIDWKSNYLGPTGPDYGPTAMNGAMAEHAYILQYHLYTLALDRHLRASLPGYRYADHFGGVLYLFLRGIDPATPLQGIYRDKPAPEYLERACTLLPRHATAPP